MGRDGNVARMATGALDLVNRYFDAVGRRDLDALAACWAQDGAEHVVGQIDAVGPSGVRAWFGELFAAFPDMEIRVRETIAQDDRIVVLWSGSGTFAGTSAYQGIEPTGARVEIEGLDLLQVSHGHIVRNDAFPDGLGLARQIGLLPAHGSPAEERLTKAFNARTRALSHVAAEPQRIADGVWLVRGGFPRKLFNVYLIEDSDGVTVFDAGIRAMTNAIAAAAVTRGGLSRVVRGQLEAAADG